VQQNWTRHRREVQRSVDEISSHCQITAGDTYLVHVADMQTLQCNTEYYVIQFHIPVLCVFQNHKSANYFIRRQNNLNNCRTQC